MAIGLAFSGDMQGYLTTSTSLSARNCTHSEEKAIVIQYTASTVTQSYS